MCLLLFNISLHMENPVLSRLSGISKRSHHNHLLFSLPQERDNKDLSLFFFFLSSRRPSNHIFKCQLLYFFFISKASQNCIAWKTSRYHAESDVMASVHPNPAVLLFLQLRIYLNPLIFVHKVLSLFFTPVIQHPES